MPASDAIKAPETLWLKAQYGGTIFLSAFLLFQVQPVMGKMILPWYGGAASVWTTCLLFFQSMLLLGYIYTHFLVRRLSPRPQAVLHIALLVLAVAMLPISPNLTWKPLGNYSPSLHLLGVLALSVGLPYFVLSTTGPLVQVWFSRERPGTLPYRLFALSNVGSMIGLLSYPFAIEPVSSISEQSSGWSFGFIFFALLCGSLAWRGSKRASLASNAVQPQHPSAPPSLMTQLTWVFLAACPSLLLVSLTSHLTRDVAPIPMLWIAPLTIYLLSFSISFDHRRWYKRIVFAPLLIIAVVAVCYLAAVDFGDLDIKIVVSAYLLAFFVFSMVCHGELARLAPPTDHLTTFYLLIAGGGTLGGLFVAILAPQVFSGDYEFQIGVVLTIAVASVVYAYDRQRGAMRYVKYPRTLILLTGMCAAIGSGYIFVSSEMQRRNDTLLASRNFYGSLRVDHDGSENDLKVTLMHGVIVHGAQFVDPDRLHWPTTYYGESSGIGITLNYFNKRLPVVRVGVIGLGAGTLASYGRTGDQYRFYEINPAVQGIAHSYFSFLRDSHAAVNLVSGDARLSLEREAPQRFDVLAIDAFSGDSIPMHLLTREAFREYIRHMAPGGVLAVHASNQYLNLAPIVMMAANEFGMKARIVTSEANEDQGVDAADWVLVTANPHFLSNPDVKGVARTIYVPSGTQTWTDDFSSILPILL